MPSPDDFDELKQNCTLEWTTQNGEEGYLITGSNGNSIFFPNADRNYWSSSLFENFSFSSYCLFFDQHSFDPWDFGNRHFGHSVRPVCPSSGDTKGHVAVDLGLPSGKLWADCNVGASTPEAGGDYFAWGETEGRERYDESTYKYLKEGSSEWQDITKYTADDGAWGSIWYRAEEFVGDGKTTLEAEDDAATANWGEKWRMPSAEEWKELINEENCTWTWKEVKGVKGYEVVSKITGNSIFLPVRKYQFAVTVERGYYWSSSLSDYSVYGLCLYFNPSDVVLRGYESRCKGYSVRPVCPVQE